MKALPQSVQTIFNTFHKAGYEIYAVGGSVRDILMDRPTHGWDFTTNAIPEEILKLFPDSFYDNQFGTVGIKIYESGPRLSFPRRRESVLVLKETQIPDQVGDDKAIDIYEVTTYRSEKGYTDHRHPDKIQWGKSLKEDLSRRDFTINAIAYDGKTLIDPYHGQEDVIDKIIRAVGEPNARIEEDALRMVRAVRIASELGFMIEPKALTAIKTNAQLITDISAERVRDELLRILASAFAADGILLLKQTGLLKIIIPELDGAFAIGQKSPARHHIYDVGTHSVMAMKLCPSKDPVVRLATLLHDIGKVPTYKVDEKGIVTFYNHEMVSTKLAKVILIRLRFSRKRFIRHVGKENLPDMLALRTGDRLGGGAAETSWRMELFKKRLEEVQKQPFTVADLKIDGFDVMKALNVKPGPIIGKVLNDLFSEVEAGTLNNEREVLLERLKSNNIPNEK
jgi:tRNA nucleotidyltransferase (CCA-adding enzyme)